MDRKSAIKDFAFHHVGLLTEDINHSKSLYMELFGEGNVSDVITVKTQGVLVCFVKMADASYIELVQPVNDESIVFKMLKKRVSYYHLAYKVKDIETIVTTLEEMNYKAMGFFNSEAFDGKRCIFLFTPETHLIELIEE
jgi:methylmalonyl-CoA/ethylmalonyl-CoA epimerase